ncbi:MAG: helix-hairpin-helix domain-containing protein [Flavisolibacter sp.]
MDNYAIAEKFSLLSQLMDIHGENSFKSKSYASAAFALEKLPQDIKLLPQEKIFLIKGIGESVGKKIIEILETGELKQLNELISKTPEGVLEMINIKGLGPKKINFLWKDLEISSIRALQKACENNIIAQKKGFGDKTQKNILSSILFQKQNSGKNLYAKIESFAEAMTAKLKEKFKKDLIEITGTFRRQMEVIESIDWVTTVEVNRMKDFLISEDLLLVSDKDGVLILSAEDTLLLKFYIVREHEFCKTLFTTSCSPEFLQAWEENSPTNYLYNNEEEIFTHSGVYFIPPFQRETKGILEKARTQPLDKVIQTKDIKGLIHAHSNWSDGASTIEEMATELIKTGFEYLVLSDHSKAAFYANGLSEEKIKEQHHYINELNKKLSPFKIFKSIECDILNDGILDYSNHILSSFDLVITSIHSNLEMDEEKSMKRLLGAITNPYTTILGHMSGRLLLKRKGYPLDHQMIIEACATHHVVIEINASPRRLDMDWRWIEYGLDKGILFSVNPDAHTLEEFKNIKYGVAVAQKGGLTSSKNLSSMGREEFEKFLSTRKSLKPIGG